jgi:hypothetical protein
MNTLIRCGVEAVYEGRTHDTQFLISAIGEEVVVQELFGDRQDDGEVRARVPISNPDALPELHRVMSISSLGMCIRRAVEIASIEVFRPEFSYRDQYWVRRIPMW